METIWRDRHVYLRYQGKSTGLPGARKRKYWSCGEKLRFPAACTRPLLGPGLGQWKLPRSAVAGNTEAHMPKSSKSAFKRKTRSGNHTTSHKPSSRNKIDTLIQYLKRHNGASIAVLCKATNWQPHSIRSALSRLHIRGYKVSRIQGEGCVTRYRID